MRYLELTGRPEEQIDAGRGLREGPGPVARSTARKPADYTDVLELDLATRRAEPRRPAAARRIACRCAPPRASTASSLKKMAEERAQKNPAGDRARRAATLDGQELRAEGRRRADRRHHQLHQHLQSRGAWWRRACWRARRAQRGLEGQALGEDQPRARLARGHRLSQEGRPARATSTALGFDLVGYGCTTCIGNSGPLKPEISAAVKAGDVIACSVLSGNRNFEGRVHPEVRMNFLASPPLVVAYALAGHARRRPHHRAARHRQATASRSTSRTSGRAPRKCRRRSQRSIDSTMFTQELRERVHAATSTGAASRCRPARSTPGMRSRPTSRTRPTSTA